MLACADALATVMAFRTSGLPAWLLIWMPSKLSRIRISPPLPLIEPSGAVLPSILAVNSLVWTSAEPALPLASMASTEMEAPAAV